MSSTEIVKNRHLGFLIWQSVHSTILFLFCKIFLLSPFSNNPLSPSIFTFLSFLTFHLSLVLFSTSLLLVSSSQPDRPASIYELILFLLRFLLNSVLGGGGSPELSAPSFRSRVRTSLGFLLFVIISAASGFVSVASVCRNSEAISGLPLIGIGLRGSVFGLLYGVYYIYKQRWVLGFPIIQRPPFFSFKMGLPSAFKQALKLSTVALLCSSVLDVALPSQYKSQGTMVQFIVNQIIFYIGSSMVSFCWELCHHLHQVVHTKRYIFAPPKGSAAAETNPSEPLLAALEESTPRSLLQYLAYLDLCIICESNVDIWRRAAFFEETGETYKRVVAVCLRPLEQLTSNLGEGLEGCSGDRTDQLSHQLLSPADTRMDSKLNESFNDFQLCAWCAMTIAALTARSHSEDRFGVAQLTGCNAAVVSTLLSSLVAVEACMGKKTNVQTPHLMGPASIKWAALNTGRRDGPPSIAGKKRGGPLHAKAYAMADIIRTSIYSIVSVFHDEMLGSMKAGVLEKDWITDSKPLFGTREILVQKLGLFLDFQAN
ncbi:uncharacterized protein LOC122646085 [Telopea speciosissima]|uniref:uncharacterized protein LOC122646085 n=1 Tax=Telopea speciosissima TaxID=54955 RepID=UPI001CC385BB|nr:uncharacterized protein LOC122646085 [Telopea speciosissima]